MVPTLSLNPTGPPPVAPPLDEYPKPAVVEG